MPEHTDCVHSFTKVEAIRHLFTASKALVSKKIVKTSLSVKILKVKIVNYLVDKIISHIINRFERSKITQPGIYQYSNSLNQLMLCISPNDIKIDPKKPVLLFIHGTISSSRHGFSDMWSHSNTSYITKLLAPYKQQIFFLEHYTISVSPIENTLTVAQLFPKGTYFHIISHSRGGIIGELLCQSQLKRRKRNSKKRFIKTNIIFSKQELAPFKNDPKRKADYEGLKQLQSLFLERQFSVERFVRIAAPMNGTALASKSIDEVVSKVFSTLNTIPLPHLLGIRAFFSALAFTFIKKARSVELMPGIESMMPSSPLIMLLNRHSVQLQDELSIIAGETTSKNGIKALKHKWLTQHIFKESHDLVVNISAAFGGCHRLSNASRYYIKKGGEIGHFNYFQHTTVLQKIQEALSKPLGTLGTFKFLSSNHRQKRKTRRLVKHFSWESLAPCNKNNKKLQPQLINSFILNVEGLVSNIFNQLFYIPSSDGWQSHDSGDEITVNSPVIK